MTRPTSLSLRVLLLTTTPRFTTCAGRAPTATGQNPQGVDVR
jgi:hypothetical protein